MYYEEKIINGVLMCRSNPKGDWEQCSITEMSRDIINQYIQDHSGWVSTSLIKLEDPCLLLTERGQIVTGWLGQLDDERYFCFGNEFTSWDFEWNFDIGAVVGWKPLPPTEEA